MVTLEEVELIGYELMGKKFTRRHDYFIRRFRGWYGIDPAVVVILWNMLETNCTCRKIKSDKIIHLMWALHFLEKYGAEHQHLALFNVDEKTYRKWIWLYIGAISSLVHRIVS